MVKYAIVIPAYKAADTIAETLHSIAACQPEINQALAVFVIDDCSPDHQVEVACASWHTDLSPLEIVRSERNGGVWASTTLGIERAHEKGAEWVLILHADDIAKPQWIRMLLETIATSDSHVASVCSSYDVLETNGQIKQGDHKPEQAAEKIFASPKSIHDTLLMGCWWHISGVAIRIAAYQEVGTLNPRYGAFADWDWTLRIFSSGKWGIAYLPQTLTYYRQHANTITAQTIRTTARVEEQVEIVSRFAPYLTRIDHLRWHGQQLYFTARRIARDVLTRNGNGLKTDGRTARVLVRSAVRHILGGRV
jgi:glycosyltransferase involved in cell wall biosynthesis